MNYIFYSHLIWEANYCKELFFAMARHIGKSDNVICVDRCCNIFPDIFIRPHRFIKWLRNHRAKKLEENVTLCRPLILFHDQIAKYWTFLSRINRAAIKIQLNRYINTDMGIVSYICNPFMHDYLKIFAGEISLYDCLAEWRSYPGMGFLRKSAVKKYESKTLLKSDVVLAVSKKLYDRRVIVNRNTHYLPWAAEYILFSKDSYEMPKEMMNVNKPIIGFIGNIWGIFDVDIIAKLSEMLKNANIIIMGSLQPLLPRGYKRKFMNIIKRRNIRWLGPYRHEDLPKYLKCFDVCIIPFIVDDWTITCSPGKLYQYLAAGKPIVSTDLPEVSKYCDEDIVKIARSPEEFIEKVNLALNETADKNKIMKRKEIARHNSWDSRAGAILDIINEYAQANGGFDYHEQLKSSAKA